MKPIDEKRLAEIEARYHQTSILAVDRDPAAIFHCVNVIPDLVAEVRRLREAAEAGAPLPCHGDVIAEWLDSAVIAP